MGTGEFNAGGNPAKDKHSFQGGVQMILVTSCYRTGISSALMGHLARVQTHWLNWNSLSLIVDDPDTAEEGCNLNHEYLSFIAYSLQEMFKTIDEDDDNRLDAGELLVMVSAAMQTEIGADLQTAKEVLEGARDEFGKFAHVKCTCLHVLSAW